MKKEKILPWGKITNLCTKKPIRGINYYLLKLRPF